MKYCLIIVWAGMLSVVGTGALAQSPAAPPDTLELALLRIAVLEARVAELEGRLAAAGVETRRLEEVAGLEPKAELAEAADARFDVRYDAAADRTTVVGPVLSVESNRRLSSTRFLLAPAVAFAGKRPEVPARFV